jgi:hypothetical protein
MTLCLPENASAMLWDGTAGLFLLHTGEKGIGERSWGCTQENQELGVRYAGKTLLSNATLLFCHGCVIRRHNLFFAAAVQERLSGSACRTSYVTPSVSHGECCGYYHRH